MYCQTTMAENFSYLPNTAHVIDIDVHLTKVVHITCNITCLLESGNLHV